MDHGRVMVPARASSHSTIAARAVRGALDVVVPHHVAEAMRLLELRAREVDPLADLAGALGRALAEPALELGDVCGDEDRHAARATSSCTLSAPSSSSSSTQTFPSSAIRSISERSVPYRRPETYGTHSRNASVLDPARELVVARGTSTRARRPRPGAGAASLRRRRPRGPETRSRRPLISVPFPAPDGPVTTKTGRADGIRATLLRRRRIRIR